MNGRRAVIGLCMLCALVVSGLAAQTAAAAPTGTTAYTCVAGGQSNAKFNSATCNETSVGGGFGHTAIGANDTTELSGNAVGATELKSTHAGVKLALRTSTIAAAPKELCKDAGGVEHLSWMENKISGEEMFVKGEGCITYSNVEVVEPAGKGCEVTNSKMITTNLLKATTQGQGMFLKFEPASGAVFASFTITGCSVGSLNTTYNVEGSVKGLPKGTMTQFTETETTTQGTLTLGGQPAGIGGELELKGRVKNTSGAFTPLGVTTPNEEMS
jgi:hypothetical protein